MADRPNKAVDITNDGGAAAKQGAGKAPAKPAAKKPANKKEAGKKKSGAGAAVFVIILLILIGGFVFEEIKYNYLGTRDIVINAVVKLDPEYKTWEEKYAELSAWEAELDKRDKAAASKETQQETRQTELDAYAKELEEREINRTPIYRLPISGRELEDMQSLSTTYAQMAPATAAEILVKLYERQDVAAILYYMSERNAAAVMSQMDKDYVARITEILLYM